MKVSKQEWIELWKILGTDFYVDSDEDHPAALDDEELPHVFDIRGVAIIREDSQFPLTPIQKQVFGKQPFRYAASVIKQMRKTGEVETLVITFPKTERDAVIAAINTTKAKIEA